jgi:hypothetical protein
MIKGTRILAMAIVLVYSPTPIFALEQSAVPMLPLISKIKTAVANGIQEKIRKSDSSQYFMTVFAYQDKVNSPQASHTFATFTKVDPSGKKTDYTISWLPENFPQTRSICVFKGVLAFIQGKNRCEEVKGKNFSLEETLEFAAQAKRKVFMWGPTKIHPKFFEFAMQRIKQLENNELRYVADDRWSRKRGTAVNCLHAVSDLGGTQAKPGGLWRTELFVWGNSGTRHILRTFNEHQNAFGKSDWLAEKIYVRHALKFDNIADEIAERSPASTDIQPKISGH